MDATTGKSAAVTRMLAGIKSRLLFTIEVVLGAVVLLSLTFPGVDERDRSAILAGLLCYWAFVLAARQLRRAGARHTWTFAAQTLGMIPFITWSMWFTDKLESPLRTGYLVAIVASALIQPLRFAMAHVALAAAGIIVLEETHSVQLLLSHSYVGSLLTRVAPLIIVAYVTTVYASLFRYDLSRSRLKTAVDPVTGLKDLFGFAIVADRLLMSAERRGNPAAMLLIGVDDQQGVISRHGPDASNQLLRTAATRLSGRLRHNDLAARCAQD